MNKVLSVLSTTWRTLTLGWHLSRMLLHALRRGVVGLIVGLPQRPRQNQPSLSGSMSTICSWRITHSV